MVLRMKRELMDLVKAAEYASALMACDKLAAVVPRDALVAQYRAVLREKVAMDEAKECDPPKWSSPTLSHNDDHEQLVAARAEVASLRGAMTQAGVAMTLGS